MVSRFLTVILLACSVACTTKPQFAQVDDGSVDASGDRVFAVSQDVAVRADTDVDILFVVDNSPSMEKEQVGIADKIDGFMRLVKDLNWHIALTTTDARLKTVAADGTRRAWGDGQFRPFDADDGSLFVLKAGEVSLSAAQTKLARAIQVGTMGGSSERGINATYRAVERMSDTPSNADFFRPNARLAVIAITDEDECSNGSCLATAMKSVPANLLSFVHATFGIGKVFTFNSIARFSFDTTCKTAGNASVYETMSKLTSGVMGSVCSTDYTSILSQLGTRVVEMVDSVHLGCAPVDMTGDLVEDVSIVSSDDGAPILTNFKVQGELVTFAQPLAEGSYRVTYHCKQ